MASMEAESTNFHEKVAQMTEKYIQIAKINYMLYKLNTDHNLAYTGLLPKQVDAGLSIVSRMEKILEKQYIVIEADGVLQLYPVNNIKSIQFYPVPNRLPEYVIRDATSVDLNY